jgi:hypothetical protein
MNSGLFMHTKNLHRSLKTNELTVILGGGTAGAAASAKGSHGFQPHGYVPRQRAVAQDRGGDLPHSETAVAIAAAPGVTGAPGIAASARGGHGVPANGIAQEGATPNRVCHRAATQEDHQMAAAMAAAQAATTRTERRKKVQVNMSSISFAQDH